MDGHDDSIQGYNASLISLGHVTVFQGYSVRSLRKEIAHTDIQRRAIVKANLRIIVVAGFSGYVGFKGFQKFLRILVILLILIDVCQVAHQDTAHTKIDCILALFERLMIMHSLVFGRPHKIAIATSWSLYRSTL
jgi:hypothetical protein